ncbi:MAG: ABC transporter permease [Oscillospiraceae bacterium]
MKNSSSPRSLLPNKRPLWKKIAENKILYLMLAPTLIYFIFFRVWPIINMRLAFFTYKSKGPWEWAGLKYFKMIFSTSAFSNILTNTLIISFMKYVMLFPFFVIFALLLNELRSKRFRKIVQVVSYLPHFLSWVVIAGIWISALNQSSGVVNQIITLLGGTAKDFMTDKGAIRWVLLFSEAWRSIGWDSIVFFIAIINIDPTLYEAAMVDGASRMKIITRIILPALVVPMTTVFILNLGFFMTAGFDQVFNFTNPAVNSAIDILDTYTYRLGLENGQYSLASAVSLLKGVVGMGLVYITHKISKKVTGKGVW